MKILITSGGTKINLDPVRSITNMSSGTLGAQLAKNALFSKLPKDTLENNVVIFLHAKGSKSPFVFNEDSYFLSGNHFNRLQHYMDHIKFCEDNRTRFLQHEYSTYDEYHESLQRIIEDGQPDIVILAAAVSDYTADFSNNKIKSSNELTINLRPTEKIISKIKQWHPKCKLVGFKLLVDATKEDMDKACLDSIQKNDCDIVVGNSINSTNNVEFFKREFFLYNGKNVITSYSNDLYYDIMDLLDQE